MIDHIIEKNATEENFIQSIREVYEQVGAYLEQHPHYKKAKIFERMCEAERIFIFRVPWIDDQGEFQINRGFRVQMNSAIGPYKGGLRLHPSVNLDVLKFLGFEQIFKNSLTTLPLGAGKGGADFDPKGKSDNEVMRFCQSYMTELSNYIGANVDVPAGDIGTSSREIGYMFGQYKRIARRFTSAMTGKDASYGGIHYRPEATGYGCVYFAREMLTHQYDSLDNKRCNISGAGNVAIYTAEKLLQLDARPITLSDSRGFLYAEEGLTKEQVEELKTFKLQQRKPLQEFAGKHNLAFYEGAKPWSVPSDIAFPSAIENEIGETEAQEIIKNGCHYLLEGANMPCTDRAHALLREAGVTYIPGKAANAGGVAVSGLEMVQGAQGLIWEPGEVDYKLQHIMKQIHDTCQHYGQDHGSIDYVKGANVGGFVRVADAMMAQGLV